jgi:adenylosuccinate lyase
MSLQSGIDNTMATQWMERTLDDSAIRRLSMPQAFLSVDACLIIYRNISDGMVVYPKVIEKNLNAELPFMATEEILMAGVQAGGDRQELHEVIRVHSQKAADRVKIQGDANDLIERLKTEPAFASVDLEGTLDARLYIGRAPEQVDAFIKNCVEPVRKKFASELGTGSEDLRV